MYQVFYIIHRAVRDRLIYGDLELQSFLSWIAQSGGKVVRINAIFC